MKKKLSFLLSLAIVMAYISPLTAFAMNETSGSTTVTVDIPFPSNDNNLDDTPSYSYVVNIPSGYIITSSSFVDYFEITATEMNIPEDKQVVVRIDNTATFENDGNFYLYLGGDKTSENYIMGYIDRHGDGRSSSVVMGPDNVVASFNPQELIPCDWQSLRVILIYDDGAGLAAGTYSGTIYYTIGLE